MSLVCPALVATDAGLSGLKRPAQFADSGFAPVDEAELRQFASIFQGGKDPLEVGEKILAGMNANAGLIFTHPEFAEDFKDIYETASPPCPTNRSRRNGWRSSASAARPPRRRSREPR